MRARQGLIFLRGLFVGAGVAQALMAPALPNPADRAVTAVILLLAAFVTHAMLQAK